MDKLAKYQNCIQELLTRYASEDQANSNIEVQLIFDLERGHYQWMNVGWQGSSRIYQCVVHFDLQDDKI
jgi:XisI protein